MKYIFTSIIASLTLTSCTITPEQADSLKALDEFIHLAATRIIVVEPIKK